MPERTSTTAKPTTINTPAPPCSHSGPTWKSPPVSIAASRMLADASDPCANTPAWSRRGRACSLAGTACGSHVPLDSILRHWSCLMTQIRCFSMQLPDKDACNTSQIVLYLTHPDTECDRTWPARSTECQSSRRPIWCWTCCSWPPPVPSIWSGNGHRREPRTRPPWLIYTHRNAN